MLRFGYSSGTSMDADGDGNVSWQEVTDAVEKRYGDIAVRSGGAGAGERAGGGGSDGARSGRRSGRRGAPWRRALPSHRILVPLPSDAPGAGPGGAGRRGAGGSGCTRPADTVGGRVSRRASSPCGRRRPRGRAALRRALAAAGGVAARLGGAGPGGARGRPAAS